MSYETRLSRGLGYKPARRIRATRVTPQGIPAHQAGSADLAKEHSFGIDAVSVAGGVAVWGGSAWTVKPVKVWTGAAWVAKPVKRFNGSAWVAVS